MFIDRLYWAIRIYSSSYGIAWFDPEAFRRVLLLMADLGSCSSKDIGMALREFKFGKHGREGSYFLRLLWHLDLAVVVKRRGGLSCKLSSRGLALAQKLRHSVDFQELRRTFSKWLPLLYFLHFINSKGRVSEDQAVKELGGEMKRWSMMAAKIGILKRGNMAKPYNSFVVRNLFTPLAKTLGLVEEDSQGMAITDDGRELLRNLDVLKEHDVVRTMPGEMTIYAGIADVLSDAKEVYVASPWINHQLYELIRRVKGMNSPLQHVVLITRPSEGNREVARLVKSVVDVNTYYYKRLHAKVALNPRGPATESSANLLKTSLLQNFEIGTYYTKTPERLLVAVEELQSIAAK